jgi:hypothetical protein
VLVAVEKGALLEVKNSPDQPGGGSGQQWKLAHGAPLGEVSV